MKRAGVFLMMILSLWGQVVLAQEHQDREKKNNKGAPGGMVKIPGGSYQPFLQPGNQPDIITVRSFYIDIYAVTNEEFLAFVKANPRWARSKVSRLYADNNYLRQWAGDFIIGNKKIYNSPVTNISWFAANAYCKWKGTRMPTMNEWEYAGGAAPAGMKKGQKLSTIILDWYGRPTPPVLPPVGSTFKNSFGVYDMHGLIWEWVYDFNSIITGGGSGNTGAGQKNLFCAAGSLNAANKEDYAAFMRYAFRESLKGAYCVANLGFRCAMDIPQKNSSYSNR